MDRKKVLSALVILLFGFGLLWISRQRQKLDPVSPITRSGFYFDTIISLTVYQEEDLPCLEEALLLCQEYESLFSRTVEGSDIWNINHSAGNPVLVDERTSFLLKQMLSYAEMTEGLLDPTIAPLMEAWNFTGNPAGPVPSTDTIKEALSHVDYHNLQIEGNTVTLTDPQASVDLGCIAKGYIADQLKQFFLKKNVTSALINLGGNVLAVGSHTDQTPFRAGIRKPFADDSLPADEQMIAVIFLVDQSLVTSGNDQRCFYEDGILYHHLLDPYTGMPADTGLDSVTILSDSSMEADALSTICFLLGEEKARNLIDSLTGTEALFCRSDGTISKTAGFP